MTSISALHNDKRKSLAKGKIAEAAAICNLLGVKLQEKGDFDEALQQHEEEILLYDSLDDVIGVAVANRRLGEIHSETGNYEKALLYQKKHLELSVSAGNNLEEQRAHATIGRTHFMYSELLMDPNSEELRRKVLREAELSYLKSLEACKSLTGQVDVKELGQMRCRVYHNLGLVLDAKKNYSKAIDFIYSGLEICKKYSLVDDAYRSYAELSQIHLREGNLKQAKEEANLCLKMSHKMQSKNDQVDAHVLSGNILLHENNFQGARRELYKAHKLNHSRKEVRSLIDTHLKIIVRMCLQDELVGHIDTTKQGVMDSYDKLGDYFSELNFYSKAIEFYLKVLQKAIELDKSPSELAPIYVSLAQTFKDNKQYDKSLEYFQKELSMYSDSDFKESIKTLVEMNSICKLWGSYTYSYIDKALAIARKSNYPQYIAFVLNQYVREGNSLDPKRLQDCQEELSSIVEKNSLEEYEFLSTDEKDMESSVDEINLSEINFTDSDDEERRVGQRCPKRGGLIRKVNEQGESLLHRACIRGQVSTVKQLISQGHPINPRDNCGWTPLHEACNFGHTEIVELLIDAGAFINDRGGVGCQGTTPLHDAATNGHLDVMRMLLQKKASVIARDDNGKSPLDCLFLYSEQDSVSEGDRSECRVLQNSLMKKMQSLGYEIPEKYLKLIEDHRNGVQTDIILEDPCDSSFCEDTSERFSPEPEKVSATDAYKDVMECVGSRARKKTTSTVEKAKSKSVSLVSEGDYVTDDWLVNDLDTSTRNKRKRAASPMSSTQKQLKQKKKQVKMTKFLDNEFPEEKELEVEDVQAESHEAQSNHCDEILPCSPSNACTLTISIQIGDRKLLIPIPNSWECKPISWLQQEVSKRYTQLEGIRTSLKLYTKQEEALNPDDSIDMLRQNQDLKASIIEYHVPPLSERYCDVCKVAPAKFSKRIESKLQATQMKDILDLSKLFIRDNLILDPLISALHYQNLTSLDLSSNKIRSWSHLSQSISKMPKLTSLTLKCCSLESKWFVDFATSIDKARCGLKHIDVSYNDFRDVKMSDFAKFCGIFQLRSLVIQSCSLKLGSPNVNGTKLSNINALNLSYNEIPVDSVNGLLLMCNKVTHFSIAYNSISLANKLTPPLTDLLGRDDASHVIELNFAGCHLQDADLRTLISYLYRCSNLKSLVLSNNDSLSEECLIDLMKEISGGNCVPLQELYLEGVPSSSVSRVTDSLVNCIRSKQASPFPMLSVSLSISKLQKTNAVAEQWQHLYEDHSEVTFDFDSLYLSYK